MQTQFQYRASNYFYMIGMVVEPTIYLVVWRTIAESSGGTVEGYTAGTFAGWKVIVIVIVLWIPIAALVGPITRAELWLGVLMQVFWVACGALLVRVVWR